VIKSKSVQKVNVTIKIALLFCVLIINIHIWSVHCVIIDYIRVINNSGHHRENINRTCLCGEAIENSQNKNRAGRQLG
jgi:hypothetical protein